MIDTFELKSQINLAALVESDLGPSPKRSGRWMLWRCPFHEDHNPSLSVTADNGRFHCFACGESGDAIAWLQKREKLSFREACDRLATTPLPPPPRPAVARPATGKPPAPRWRDNARRFVARCAEALWSERGAKARAWLRARGLEEDTIKAWRLGLNADKARADYGITIPWFCGNDLWLVNIRRPKGKPKYKALAGSKRGGLFGVAHLAGHADCFAVEGELDCLLLWQETNLFADVVTAGCSGSGLTDRWLSALMHVKRFWIATDNDAGGEAAAKRWLEVAGKRGKRALPPVGAKDVSDAFVAGHDLAAWAWALIGEGWHK